SFLVLSVWRQPTLVLWVSIALVSSALIARLFILRRLTGLAVGYYIRRVISRVVLVGSVATLVNHLMVFQGASGISLVAGLVASLIGTLFVVYLLGLDASERKYLLIIVMQAYRKLT